LGEGSEEPKRMGASHKKNGEGGLRKNQKTLKNEPCAAPIWRKGQRQSESTRGMLAAKGE